MEFGCGWWGTYLTLRLNRNLVNDCSAWTLCRRDNVELALSSLQELIVFLLIVSHDDDKQIGWSKVENGGSVGC
jgi:hypothetical protein